jgi:hypothetical protein
MLNLKQKLQSLVKSALVVIAKWQLARVNKSQRDVVDGMLIASSQRIHAQQYYTDLSNRNAARKRLLLERLDRLTGAAQARAASSKSAAGLIELPIPDVRSLEQAWEMKRELELRIAAGTATCGQADPADQALDWAIPCDIVVGGRTIRRGATLRTLVDRMNVLHAMAAQAFPKAASMTVEPTGSIRH